MHPIILVLSSIFPSVFPREHALSLHHVILPLAYIITSICPGVCALASTDVIHEIACVGGAIRPGELSMAVAIRVLVVAFVSGGRLSAGPDFTTLSLLLVGYPLALVRGIIGVADVTGAVSHAVLHVALVD